MGKQKQVLRIILDRFQLIQSTTNEMKIDFNKTKIKVFYKKSLNKNDLVYRILNEVVLSNDEIIELLRIIFYKEK